VSESAKGREGAKRLAGLEDLGSRFSSPPSPPIIPFSWADDSRAGRAGSAIDIPLSVHKSMYSLLRGWNARDGRSHKMSELVGLVIRAGLPLVEKQLGLRNNGKET
jgi:hypothetical protein